MSNEFLNILYKQEAESHRRLRQEIEQLEAIQKLIGLNGGAPKYKVGYSISTAPNVIEIPYDQEEKENPEPYNKIWYWDKKAIYAFKKLGGRSTPRGVIETLIKLEGAFTPLEKARVQANAYNAISRLSRSESKVLIKDESSPGFYVLANEDAFMEDL